MAKEICISTTPHETRLAIVEDDQLTEIYYERENEYTLAGSIYKGKVTRVLPGMQSAFVDVGLERDAFLYVTDFLEEQEESADFEAPKQSGGRRERGEGRQDARPEKSTEARPESRQDGGRGGRRAEPQRAVPAEARGSAATEAEGEELQLPAAKAGSDAQPQDEFAEGTRRWRGRRGRRRGVRGNREAGGEQSSAPAETGAAEDDAAGGNEYSSISIDAEAAPAREHVREQAPERSEARSQSQERGGSRGSRSQAPATTLPGEALQKYGQLPSDEGKPSLSIVEEEPLPQTPYIPYTATRPSTLVDHPIAWDGVSVALPGESLSRHGGQPASALPAASAPGIENAPIMGQDLMDDDVMDQESVLEEAAQTPLSTTEPELHAVASETAPIDTVFPPAHPELHPGESHSGAEEHASAGQQPTTEEQGGEFDPDHASASHRVDPSAPSEFRLSSLFGRDPGPEKPDETPDHVANELEGGGPSDPHSGPEGGAAGHGSAAEASRESAYSTNVTGQEQHESDSSQQHAGAEAHSQEAASLDDLHAFTPGDGEVEEEVIDEEEYDFAPLPEHAGAHEDEHDLGDLVEEETQAGNGTEIGESIREAQIERQVISSDDDDFEEDDEETAEGGEEEEDRPATAVAGEEGQGAPRRPGRNDRQRGGRERGRGGRGRNGRRQSAQTSDLPVISELLKQGQEILVQIAKEPIAKKGARITSHIALPGRFLVFMPTVSHVGVSRKIWSEEERQRLKRVLISEKGDATGGFIVRTAAENATEEELRADLRFLISLWAEIKQRSDAAKAPALIYHDLNLIERILRDQVSDSFSTIWVDSEAEYERIVRFLNRFQPSLVRRVKLYTKETPLFEQFGIQDEISKALKSKVWLKSGGSIVINQTEALVAIDINTGKYVGKTARLEDTILKTNLDAIPEIVRQIRLRDLGGIIVIDFIDMDERKNRNKVMQALEEELKLDRAPSKVLQFNDFGLVAITRKRVKQSLERTLSVQCNICAGTGMVKSPTTVANEIYIEMRKMQKHFDRHDIMLRVHPEVVKTLKGNNVRWLNELEEMTGRTIIVKSDPALHPEQFDIH
jgi:ribonuclease E